ncbi:hypothetical protein KKF91_09170 [Myxococcota bacterium]|nr:hypothetical protein [Myxococcota bacterium]
MQTLYFQLNLREPIATPLGYLPGNALLGAVAKRVYDQAGDLAWDLFHSGAVRFSDARLIDPATGAPVIPMPKSVHAPKGVKPQTLRDPSWCDLAHEPYQQGLKPLTGQLGLSGVLPKIKRGYALKTSVSFETQRAAEGLLFGEISLEAKALRCRVDLDLEGHAEQRAATLIRQALQQPLTLGANRAAEYGATIAEEIAAWPQWPRSTAPLNGQVSFICLSDLCLFDAHGQPRTTPQARDFGLDNAVLDLERCFIRVRRWIPFNRKRMRPDVERIALEAGSVITFSGIASDLDLEALAATLARGVGAYRAEGLGQILVQPLFLSDRQAGFSDAPIKQKAEPVAERPQDALGQWLEHQMRIKQAEDTAFNQAEEALRALRRYARNSSQFPSVAQWRQVQQNAIAAVYSSDLDQRLFNAPKAICTHGVSKKRWFPNGKDDSRPCVGNTLHDLVHKYAPMTIALCAHRMAQEIHRQRQKAEKESR